MRDIVDRRMRDGDGDEMIVVGMEWRLDGSESKESSNHNKECSMSLPYLYNRPQHHQVRDRGFSSKILDDRN